MSRLRAVWEWAQHWYVTTGSRERMTIVSVVSVLVVVLLYVSAIEPIIDHRREVLAEIERSEHELALAGRFIAAADGLKAEREDLRRRLREAKGRLLAGESGTLAAAALQERANTIAAGEGVTVQSTQVMREEKVDPFRKISVRFTLSGEIKQIAGFLAGLEYGPHQVTVPFIEMSRRGAVTGGRGPRNVSATVEVSGFLGGSDGGAGGAPAPPLGKIVPVPATLDASRPPGPADLLPLPSPPELVPLPADENASRLPAAHHAALGEPPPPPPAAGTPAPEAPGDAAPAAPEEKQAPGAADADADAGAPGATDGAGPPGAKGAAPPAAAPPRKAAPPKGAASGKDPAPAGRGKDPAPAGRGKGPPAAAAEAS